MAGYSLELETIKRLGKMLKAYEGGGFTPTLRQHITEDYGPPVEPGLHVIEVTGAISGGYYPANLMDWNGSAWASIYAVRVIELNAKALTTRRYFAKVVGVVTLSGTQYELYAAYSPGEVVTNITCSGGTLTIAKEKV
jgi:hypothetical protein